MRSLNSYTLLILASTLSLRGAPMVTATPSRNQVYLGSPFTVDLTISPPEAVSDLTVEPAGPKGFEIVRRKGAVSQSLGPGSNYTEVYEITPPPSGHATTEIYRIVFNVGYNHAAAPNEPKMWQSVEVPLTLSFSRQQFCIWGVVGLLLGWTVKGLGSFNGLTLSG